MLLSPNEVSYNASISALEKSQQWSWALALLSEMPAALVPPGTVSYNAALTACEKAQQWEAAVGLFSELQLSQVAPSVVTYNALISAFEKGAQWAHALSTLHGTVLGSAGASAPGSQFFGPGVTRERPGVEVDGRWEHRAETSALGSVLGENWCHRRRLVR